MTMLPEFVYHKPSSLKDIERMLASSGEIPMYLAGGTDLVVSLKSGKLKTKTVIDLKGIPGIRGISELENDRLWIGALTTMHDLEISSLVNSRAAALAAGASQVGSFQIRNRATIGGNLCNASPTADTAPPLLAMGAQVRVWGPGGERKFPVGSFWLGPGKANLLPGEVVLGLELPAGPGLRSAYIKHGARQAMDIAVVSAAMAVNLKAGVIEKAGIALGGAGSCPIRARRAETFLENLKTISWADLVQAGRLAAQDANPRSSSRATREYRLAVIPVLVERALAAILAGQVDGPAGREAGNGKTGNDNC